jgi:hypothetical protein
VGYRCGDECSSLTIHILESNRVVQLLKGIVPLLALLLQPWHCQIDMHLQNILPSKDIPKEILQLVIVPKLRRNVADKARIVASVKLGQKLVALVSEPLKFTFEQPQCRTKENVGCNNGSNESLRSIGQIVNR